jgi:hypothetical protein
MEMIVDNVDNISSGPLLTFQNLLHIWKGSGLLYDKLPSFLVSIIIKERQNWPKIELYLTSIGRKLGL